MIIMKLKSKTIILLIFTTLIYVFFFTCCKNDDNENTPATLDDVTLSQTVNDMQSLSLTNIDAELTFSSQLSFANQTINWAQPVLEQSFTDIYYLSKDNISVTDAKGKNVSSVKIFIGEDNKVKISFTKIDESYAYLKSSVFTISIHTHIKDNITDEQRTDFYNNGFETQSVFYGDSPQHFVMSNTVYVKINPENIYNVKGDPNNSNYPYKLNVVYFVASDIQANPDYKKRISTILLKHQLFVLKWMKHWGYEEKSFGLPLDNNGMVDIVTVNGKNKKADYPYNGGSSKIIEEIKAYYSQNGLSELSKHMLIISAVNDSTGNTPFYGLGKRCFALDYPGMAYESMAIDPTTGAIMSPKTSESHRATVWIGGMLHELGHALNAPHVGPTYSQKHDPAYGTSLMGSGNHTYGEKPTFLHHATAAIFNNCQVSATSPGTFYDTTFSTLDNIEDSINGGQFDIKGSFGSPKNATDIIVRFYKSSEQFLGPGGGYTSVAFVIKPRGTTSFEATIPIEEMRVNSFDYKMGVTVLFNNGTAKNTSQPTIYRLINTRTGYTFE